ncbi:MAG: flagellar basal body rod protein FlgB [Pseudomonadota bacterium]
MTQPLVSVLDRQGRVLELLAQRQQVLAGNIANADTPGFKAREVDFASALKQARVAQATLPATKAGHMPVGAEAASAGQAPVVWRTVEQPSLDGNTVDLDRERANFADNAMRYEATLRFINGHVRTMLSAITGQ